MSESRSLNQLLDLFGDVVDAAPILIAKIKPPRGDLSDQIIEAVLEARENGYAVAIRGDVVQLVNRDEIAILISNGAHDGRDGARRIECIECDESFTAEMVNVRGGYMVNTIRHKGPCGMFCRGAPQGSSAVEVAFMHTRSGCYLCKRISEIKSGDDDDE